MVEATKFLISKNADVNATDSVSGRSINQWSHAIIAAGILVGYDSLDAGYKGE